MKIFCIIIFILLVLFLQIGILPNLKIVDTYPNLFLLILISLTVLIGWKKTLGWIIAFGLFLDFYSLHNVLGIFVISMLLACLLTQFLNQRYFKKENKLSIILVFIISIIFYELLLLIVFKIFGIGYNFYLLGLIVKTAYSLVLALPIFYTIKWYVDKIK
jgi:rod shape-determining protein MreD